MMKKEAKILFQKINYLFKQFTCLPTRLLTFLLKKPVLDTCSIHVMYTFFNKKIMFTLNI
jgi:hypothetical protein